MGRGKALRRRAKLAEAANFGNLHKAQKGKASAYLPLPAAPSKKDLEDKVPASLRKLMALKAVAEGQAAGNKKRPAAAAAGPHKAQRTRPEQSSPHGSSMPARSQSGADHGPQEGGAPKQHQQAPSQQAAKGQQQQQRDPSLPVFEQPKKLKQRKKDYLNAKKLKKKKGKKAAEEYMHEKERQLVDHVQFGETVQQPLKVHLKRKHWDQAAAEKAEHERCKQVFLKQMRQAQQQQQQQQQQGGAAMPAAPAAAAAAAAAGKKRRLAALQAAAHDQLRAEVIEAYRAQRSQPAADGRATLDSLKRLVKR